MSNLRMMLLMKGFLCFLLMIRDSLTSNILKFWVFIFILNLIFRVHKKKRLIFPGKTLAKKKKKKKVLSKLERSSKDDDGDDKPGQHPVAEEHHDGPDDAGERMIRKSTRTAVIVRQAERDAIRALQASMKVGTAHVCLLINVSPVSRFSYPGDWIIFAP